MFLALANVFRVWSGETDRRMGHIGVIKVYETAQKDFRMAADCFPGAVAWKSGKSCGVRERLTSRSSHWSLSDVLYVMRDGDEAMKRRGPKEIVARLGIKSRAVSNISHTWIKIARNILFTHERSRRK